MFLKLQPDSVAHYACLGSKSHQSVHGEIQPYDETNAACNGWLQVKGPEKTLEERRSSLDAEIDSLTSILADLESSSPYKPRSTQVWIWLGIFRGGWVGGWMDQWMDGWMLKVSYTLFSFNHTCSDCFCPV